MIWRLALLTGPQDGLHRARNSLYPRGRERTHQTDCWRLEPMNLPRLSGRADPPLTPPRRGTGQRARAIDVPLLGGARGGFSGCRFMGRVRLRIEETFLRDLMLCHFRFF